MKKKAKRFVSMILVSCMAVAMLSISAFAGQVNLLTTYNGYAASGYVKVTTTTATAVLNYEVSANLKVMTSTYWSDDGTHYYYTNNLSKVTGKTVEASWNRGPGQTAKHCIGYFYIDNNNFATRTAYV